MFNDNGSFLLAMFEFIIFFAYIMCLFWIFSDIFRSKDLGGVAKTIWVLFIIVLPFLGMLAYIIARGGGMHEREDAARAQLAKQQAAYVKSVVGAQGSDSSATEQITSAKALLDSGTINQSEFDQLKAKALA